MQIAVCVSGAERLESEALTLFMRNLPRDAEIDCFCFFWEGGPVGEASALVETVRRKTEGRLRHVEVEIGRDFTMDFNFTVQKYPETNLENVVRMFRAIRRCNDLKLRREVGQGFVYDHVVRTRADVRLSTELDLGRFMSLSREFVVFPENGHWRGGLNDQFAFSCSQMMDAYASVIDYIPEHCSAGCPFHPETLLRFHLMTMRILPILAPIGATVIRQ
jgi:hypothetical protein